MTGSTHYVVTVAAMACALAVHCYASTHLTKPVELDRSSRLELEAAATRTVPGVSIRRVVADRAYSPHDGSEDPKIVARVDFEPFETGGEYVRLQMVRCVKYYAPWQCDAAPEQVVEIQRDGDPERITVDAGLSSTLVLELVEFAKSRPTVEVDGQTRKLTDNEVLYVRAVERIGRWRYQVTTGNDTLHGARIVVTWRLLVWPPGRYVVETIGHVVR